MKTDIEIAQSVELKPITDVVEKLGIDFNDLELYGKYKAKLTFDKIQAVQKEEPGKLILVTAINPTPAGEGKSTITIGLADALNKIGKQTHRIMKRTGTGNYSLNTSGSHALPRIPTTGSGKLPQPTRKSPCMRTILRQEQ